MSEPKQTTTVRALAGLIGLALLICCLDKALAHLGDLSEIQHIAGVWMSLAAYLNHGVFYPPLDADGVYAGTRYMPLLFACIAGLAPLVGNYLVAAKLSALLSVVLLLAGVFTAVRRFTGRLGDAFALTALLLTFPEGLSALLSPHADALPAALALWGLLLLDQEAVSWRRVILAALLFALALAAKFSAVAGPAAGIILLWQTGRRRQAGLLLGLFGCLAGLEIAAIQWASDGRFLDNFGSLGSGGMTWQSIRIGPARLNFALFQLSPFLLVWPIALFLLVQRARSFTVWEWYLLMTLGTTVVIFTSPGTGFNHLLELQVACVLVLARAVGAVRVPVLQGVVGVVLLLDLLLLVRGHLTEPPEVAISPAVLVEAFPEPDKILCEDSTVAVLLGQRPAVMDPFAYRVLVEHGKIDDRPLAERIHRQEFDTLVMLRRIDGPESLCPHFHFGQRVTREMLRGYQFERQIGRYMVFRPVRSALACRP